MQGVTKEFKRLRRRELIVSAAASAAAVLLTSARSAQAGNRFWINGVTSGSWSNGANWSNTSSAGPSTGQIPQSNSSVFIQNTDSSNYIVTLDIPATILSLTISENGGGSDLLNEGSFNLTVAASGGLGGTETLGTTANGRGSLTVTTGTNSTTGLISIGDAAGSYGTISLTSTGSITTNGANLQVGTNGNGTLNVSGGGTVDSGYSEIGVNSGGKGNVTISGAGSAWNNSGLLETGVSGSGTLNISSGATVSDPASVIGYNAGSSGTVTISGTGSTWNNNLSLYVGGSGSGQGGNGTLIINDGTVSAGAAVLVFGTGTVNLNGGTLSVGSLLDNGMSSMGTNSVYPNGGTLIASNALYVGKGGTGAFSQTAGCAVTPSLYIGNAGGDNGTYSLSGTGSLSVSGSVYIGGAGTGSVSTAAGTLLISGGTLSLGGNGNGLEVGAGGSGVLQQTGGLITGPSTGVFVGDSTATGSAGTYSMSGTGDLEANYLTLGVSNAVGTFLQSGGLVNVNAIEAGVGNSGSTAAGIYSISAGKLVTGTSAFGYGGGGHGTLNVSNTASITVNGGIYFGGNSNDAEGFGTLAMSGGSMSVSGTLKNWSAGTVALTGGSLSAGTLDDAGNFSESGAATSIAASNFYVGHLTSETGTYVLNSGSLNVSGPLNVGYSGIGTFAQSSGVTTVGTPAANQNLYLAYNSGSQGTLTLTSTGSLTVSGNAYVGGSYYTTGGTGNLSVSNGTLTISNTLKVWPTGTVNLISGEIDTGTLDLSGNPSHFNWGTGTLSITGTAGLTIDSNGVFGNSLSVSDGRKLDVFNGPLYVGYSGSATLTQTPSMYVGLTNVGTPAANQNLYLGYNSGAAGTLALGGVASFTTNGTEFVGYGGAGTITQSGGTNATSTAGLPQSLDLGFTAGGTGNYLMSGGALAVTGSVYVGDDAAGTFNQSGGVSRVSNNLYLGTNTAGIGTYLLSGAGSLTVINNEYIGNSGLGTFTQTGGTHTAGAILMGFYPGSVGTYTIGGSSTGAVLNAVQVSLSNSGRSYLTQLSNSTLTVDQEFVGDNSYGTFTQSAGLNTIPATYSNDYLVMGNQAGGVGYYYLSGTGSLIVNGELEDIADAGAAGFFQSAGTHTFSGNGGSSGSISIGNLSGSNGQYQLSGGVLTVNGSLYVGNSGTGTLAISNTGSATISGGLTAGQNAGSNGTVTLSSSTLTENNVEEHIGNSGLGTFIQSGGTHTVNQNEVLGVYLPSTGYYGLSGGTFTNTGYQFVGFHGNGTFAQSGGINNVSTGSPNALSIAAFPTANGGYQLTGGTLNVNGDIIVGNGGAGTFTQSGGVATTGGATLGFVEGQLAGSSGTFNLSGTGSLVINSIDEEIGEAGAGTFIQTGGTHSFNGSNYGNGIITFGDMAGSQGVYTLSGGTFNVAGNLTIGNSGNGIINQTGGTLSITRNNYGVSYLGSGLGGSGTINLSGTGVFNSAAFLQVGGSGVGQINQSGGSFTALAGLEFIGQSGACGETVTGGSFTFGSPTGSVALLGLGGVSSTFTQSAGVGTIATNPSAYVDTVGAAAIGYGTGSNGTVSLSGTASLVTTGYDAGITVGLQGGNGTFIVSGNAALTTSGELIIGGDNAGQTGGNGTFIQSSGIVTIGTGTFDRDLFLGGSAQSSGTILLGGTAALNVLGDTIVGGFDNAPVGIGNVLVSGGSMSIAGKLKVWSTGTVNLSGGMLSAGSIDDAGNIFQTGAGGTISTANLFVGNGSTELGSYALSAGTLTATGTAYLGYNGDGTFSQSGGVATIGTPASIQNLYVGYNSGAAGTVSLSGNSSLTVNGNANIGGTNVSAGGAGTVSVLSGTMSMTNALDVNATGTVNLATGQINAGSLQVGGASSSTGGQVNVQSGMLNVSSSETLGTASGSRGTLMMSGGTDSLAGLLSIGDAAGSYGTFTMNGTATLTTANANIQIGTNGNGTFNVAGGAYVSNGYGAVGVYSGATGNAFVSGTGSSWNNNYELTIGYQSAGSLTIANGGAVSDTDGIIGGFSSSAGGTVTISGAGSTWNNSLGLYIGGNTQSQAGNGILSVNGGLVTAATTLTVYPTGALLVSGGTVTAQSIINSGVAVLSGGGTITPTTIDGTGTLTVYNTAHLTATHIRQGVLNIDQSSTVTIANSSTFDNTAATSIVTDLNNSGTLDLKNNDLIIRDASQYTTVKTIIGLAYDGGAYDQAGITSSAAAANPSFALGYGTPAQIGTTTFDGQSGLASGTVLVKYTLKGDTALKGSVGLADYNKVVANFNTAQLWTGGNFHYSGTAATGTVGLSDYNNVVSNFNRQPTANVIVAGKSLMAPAADLLTTIYATGTGIPAVAPAATSGDLQLNVNTTTGDVYVVAATATAFTGYAITDATGHLLDSGNDAAGNPASEKLLSSAATTPTYRSGASYQLYSAIADNQNALAEGQNNARFQPGIATTYDTINIPGGGTIDFGEIYNTAVNLHGIGFQYSLANASDGDPVTGTTFGAADVVYFSAVSTPEPTCLSLVACGGVGLLRRRRRVRYANRSHEGSACDETFCDM